MYEGTFSEHSPCRCTDKSKLVDLMHGEISLTSELGRGTTTTFWIPFNKPQSTKRSSLMDARAGPERFRSNAPISECLSAPQSAFGDRQDKAPPALLTVRPKEDTDKEPFHQEIDRKNVHVLVVEDKYVVTSSRVVVSSFMSMNQVANILVIVLSISRSL